ncbi:Polycystin-2 [Symbiodinium microadriaticum]|uniref:Polycystin-2 n=1 Tax=Symbiodinium microadriaticum TaxID=2951 RepID=A0A1Q9D140_SYMMI|nr:Polycystin-2 [Symbiodinium microadriaticum]
MGEPQGDITEGKSLQQKVAKEAKVVTKGIRGGADKRVLLPAVLELQGEVRTSLQLFLTMTFFFVFTVAVQQHYRTYEIHLQEKNLRNQLTDPTQDISEVGQIFEWMESTWFPFLWSAPNAAGPPDSILPSREVILLGGSLLKVISSPAEECTYVPGAECYDQGERAINYDPVLNGWDVRNRRLTSSDEQSGDQGGPNFLMRLYQSTRPWLEMPSTSSSWRKVLPQAPAGKEDPPKRPRTGRVKSRSRSPPKPRRRLQGGLEVLPRDRKRTSRFRFRRDEPEKRRRLVATSSVIMDGLPMPVGDEKAAVKVIPMSRAATDVVAQLGTWQSETNQLLTMRSLIFSAETVVINRQTRITTHIIVNFLLSRGGEVFTQVRLRSLHMDNAFLAIVFGGLWVLLLFGALFVLVGRIVIAFSNGKASVHFSNLSTYVQWSIVAIGLVVVILMAMERWEMLRARALLDAPVQQCQGLGFRRRKVHIALAWVNFTTPETARIYGLSLKLPGDLVILISLFHILLLFQFLVASKGQPRLALLANTLEMAFQDILHLFVVFLFIFSAFVIAGHILFGSKLRDFSTVKGAFAKSLEQVVSFKTDWDVITEQDWWTAAIWIWCMIIVVSLVVINIVLAVIFDCYGKIRAGITDQDTLWTTIRRHFTALRNMSKWYSSFDLLTGINNSKMDVITKQGFREVFRGITDEQVEQIFDLAELRAVNDTIRGQPTLLGEAIASILLGVDDMRDGIRTIQDKQFTSYKEAKIWMEELEEPLHAPDTLWDLGPATYIVTCPYGCDVRAKPDVTSELITRLAKGDKVEVVRTQDYIAGDGLRRLMGEMQDGAHLRQDISLSSPLVMELTAGQMVDVVEVVLDFFDEDQYASRKRGRVENPSGWISLVDRDSGYRFAERLAGC